MEDALSSRMNALVSGRHDAPALVLLHSLGSTTRMWDKVLPALEAKYHVIRFDMRGHGANRLSMETLSIEDLGTDFLQLMDEMNIDRASVCGISLGGLVALWLGIHAPHRLDRLILANTAARIGSREQWEQRMGFVLRDGLSTLAPATVERWFTPQYRANRPDEMESIRAMIAGTDSKGYAACCRVLRDTDLRAEVETIRVPSLIITGTHDEATPPGEGRALHSAIPGSQYVESGRRASLSVGMRRCIR